MIEKLACNQGRNDEILNIELAQMLCETNDVTGILELVEALKGKNKGVSNDCIKVLYEIGARRPELIANYVNDFIDLLPSKNNRMVWGCMTALATIADICAEDIIKQINIIIDAYSCGSVITIDNSMTIFAKLCLANPKNQKVIFPILIEHLQTCRTKEIPQHFERISICLNTDNYANIVDVINSRTHELSDAQLRRVKKIIKRIS